MIHLSDIKNYERCETLLWRSRHEPQPFFPFVHPCASISELAVRYFGFCDYYEGSVGDDAQRALAAMKQFSVLVNPRFEAQGVRIKITLMVRDACGYKVYFGYRSCYPHESEAQRIADHLTVLKALHIPVSEVFVLCLNAAYVRKPVLDVSSLGCSIKKTSCAIRSASCANRYCAAWKRLPPTVRHGFLYPYALCQSASQSVRRAGAAVTLTLAFLTDKAMIPFSIYSSPHTSWTCLPKGLPVCRMWMYRR